MKQLKRLKVLLAVFSLTSIAGTAYAEMVVPKTFTDYEVNKIIVRERRYTKFSADATKVKEALVSTPFAVSNMNSREITETGATSLKDAIDYTAGVLNSVGDYPLYSYSRIRGFDVNYDKVMLNGAKLLANGSTLYSPEIKGLETVTVVKGPTSTIHGLGTPGGSIDLRLKNAEFKNFGRVEGQSGNKNRKSGYLDMNRQVNSKLALRLVALQRGYDLAVDQSSTKRTYIAPSVHWVLGDKDKVDFHYMYQKDHITGNDAPLRVPWGAASNNSAHDNFKIRPTQFYGWPGVDGLDAKSHYFGYTWEHKLNHSLTFTQNASYMMIDSDVRPTEAALNNASKQFSRFHVESQTKADTWNLDQYLTKDWNAGKVFNITVVGFDWRKDTWDINRSRIILTPWNLADVVSGKHLIWGPPAGAQVTKFPSLSGKATEQGFYVQNTMKYGKLSWLLGGRLGKTEQGSGSDKEVSRAKVWQTGVSYALTKEYYLYSNYATSFNPNHGKYDITDKLIGPTRGKQFEVGLKYDKLGSPSYWMLSLYTIKQFNYPLLDWDTTMRLKTPVYYTVDDKSATGVEWEGYRDLNPNLAMRFSYTYTNARYNQSAVNMGQGARVGSVPHHAFTLWFDTETLQRQDHDWNAGIGLRYLGSRLSDDNAYTIGRTILLDASLRFKLGAGSINIQGRNLMNKQHISAVRTVGGIPTAFISEGRQIFATYSYAW